jgi:hypothetical protein
MVLELDECHPKYAHVLIMLFRLLWRNVRLLVAPLLHPRQPAQLHQPVPRARLCAARPLLRFYGWQGRKVEEEGQSYGSRTGLSRRLGTFCTHSRPPILLIGLFPDSTTDKTYSGLLRCRSRVRRLQSRSPHTRRSPLAHLLRPLRSYPPRTLQRYRRHGPQGCDRQIPIL